MATTRPISSLAVDVWCGGIISDASHPCPCQASCHCHLPYQGSGHKRPPSPVVSAASLCLCPPPGVQGLEFSEEGDPCLISHVVREGLDDPLMAVMMGANVADEMARDEVGR